MTLDTLKHVRAMQETSMALESQLRDAGAYTRDCARVYDAIARGHKSGIALLWGADGKMEIVDLNGGSKHVSVTDEGEHVTIETNFEGWHNPGREEKRRDDTSKITTEAGEAPYRQVAGEEFAKGSARSHERENATKGRFEPQTHAADKALAVRLAEKRKQMTADAKRFTAEQYARNERIAAAMKERSAQIHR
ncbi:hypothetical protein [Methylocystis echinoides]|uniref:hypothetical protein n=1 Tax=Methylocystis echinoides TaxID=29468 RepID=UPI00343BEC5D